jgi:hypothetical protein
MTHNNLMSAVNWCRDNVPQFITCTTGSIEFDERYNYRAIKIDDYKFYFQDHVDSNLLIKFCVKFGLKYSHEL